MVDSNDIDVLDDAGKSLKKEKVPPVVEKPELTVETFKALQDELDVEKGKSKRLLGESFENSKKYKDLRDTVDADRKKQLEEKEDWKSRFELEKLEHDETKQKHSLTKKQVLQKDLDFEVSRYATDAHDVKDVINNLNQKSLVIDEADLSVSGIKEEVVRLRTEKPFLFKQNSMPATITTPPGKEFVKDGKLHYDDWLKLPSKEKKARVGEVDDSTQPHAAH